MKKKDDDDEELEEMRRAAEKKPVYERDLNWIKLLPYERKNHGDGRGDGGLGEGGGWF